MTLTFYICSSMGFTYIPNMESLSSLVQKLKGYVKFVDFEFNWLLALKDDLDLDKSPAQNMHLHDIMCKPNMKSLSVMAQKL